MVVSVVVSVVVVVVACVTLRGVVFGTWLTWCVWDVALVCLGCGVGCVRCIALCGGGRVCVCGRGLLVLTSGVVSCVVVLVVACVAFRGVGVFGTWLCWFV